MATFISTYATDFNQLNIIHQLVQNGYAVIDNLIANPIELQQLLAEATAASTSSTQSILIKTDQSSDIRRDLTHDVDPLDIEKLPHIAKASRTLQFNIGGIIDTFLPSPLYCRERPQFACYKGDGSFYTRHYDNPRLLQNGVDNLRRVTILLYLNEDWNAEESGGELRLHVKSKDVLDVKISPQANRCVLFFSDLIEHEVLPSHGHRLALTVWLSELMADPESGLKKEISKNDQLMRDFFVGCCGKVSSGGGK